MKKLGISLIACVLALSFLSACGSGGSGDKAGGSDNNKEPDYLKEPVTLTVAATFGDDLDKFNKQYGDRIRAKFPNVTLNFIPRGQGTGIPDLVAAGTYPDLVYANITNIDTALINTGLVYDMTELIKKHNYDLDRFEPVLLDNMRKTNPDGALYGLPMPYGGNFVMFYNKDLFDKFGVPYPKDGMTWDQVYDLAKQLSRIEGDQKYSGFSSFIGALMRDNQLSVPYMDLHADKMYDAEKWKRLFANLSRFYEIPNNERDPKQKSQTYEAGRFYTNLNVAISVNQFGQYVNFPEQLNWDMVTMPTFPEAPDTGTQIGSNYWFITKTNNHKDISFEIVKYLLSDEQQLAEARDLAEVPSLKNTSSVFQSFGQNVPALKGKNVQAVFKLKPAAAPPFRDKGLIGADPNKLKTTIENAFNRVTIDKVDINTALREAAEQIEKLVEEKKNQ